MTKRNSGNAASETRGLAILQRSDRIEASLWRRAQSEGDAHAKAELFSHYQSLAQKIASSEFAKRRDLGVEFAEIRQMAFEGLLQALAKFDHKRDVPFGAYAHRRIRGCIIDGLSKGSESTAQYRYRQRVERDRLRSLTGNLEKEEPSALSALGSLASSLAVGLMLEEDLATDPDQIASDGMSAYDTLAWARMQAHLAEQLEKLEERERFVISQHYREGLRFGQIAEVLGLSRGRISQIHKAALERLRTNMQRFR